MLAPMATWFLTLIQSRFTQAIRSHGLGIPPGTAQPQAPRGRRTASGTPEFITGERPLLAPSLAPERFRTTALFMVGAAAWWAPLRSLMHPQRRRRHQLPLRLSHRI